MAAGRACVAFLWHMHQPWYPWPGTKRAALPFARLHASSGYYDMPWLLGRFEDTRVTFNLVPSLVGQLQAYAAGELTDRALELSERDASDLSLDDQRYLLTHMCGGQPMGIMAASPRYGELLHKRGPDRKPEAIDRACRFFREDEYRDLQVLFNLAWCGFALDAEYEVVRALRAKGRDYTEDEKRALLEAMRAALSRVVGLYADAAADGRAELTCSPFYHPILPLLCRMSDAARSVPASCLPEKLWTEPEEARRQLRSALDFHERTFGALPRGLWPPEGAISDAALALIAEEGVRWAASDEEVLAASFERDARPAPHELYRPWQAADGRLSLIFRDHHLADLIGFVYRDWSAADAAADFLAHLRRVAATAAPGQPPPLISVILDGENPWGWYRDAGEGFLRALYQGIEADPRLTTVTVSDYLEQYPPRQSLTSVFPGSWVHHSFSTWIGGAEHRRAWNLLTGALEAVKRHHPHDAGYDEAQHHLMVAEGSDWFWWYSETQHTPDADVFDALFRRRVAAVYEALGAEVPAAVEEAIHAERAVRLTREATGWMRAVIDGKVTTYFEWQPAALMRTSALASAMQRSVYAVQEIYFGFDPEHLWLRLDTDGPAVEQLRGCRLEVIFDGQQRHVMTVAVDPATEEPVVDGDLCADGHCRVGRIIESVVPLSALGVELGDTLRMAVIVRRGDHVIERWPEVGFLEVHVPTPETIAERWFV